MQVHTKNPTMQSIYGLHSTPTNDVGWLLILHNAQRKTNLTVREIKSIRATDDGKILVKELIDRKAIKIMLMNFK